MDEGLPVVIDRIREPLVRWLLRYGSVPRRLTRRYVLDVLAPFMVQAASGDPALDDPMLDPITQWRGRPLFPTGLPDLPVLPENAWADLQRYVSGSSWVSQAPGEPDTLLLKTEVLAPLRAILADRPVLRQLHERSVQYYAELAGQDTIWRARYLGEMIYHLARSGADDLVEVWQLLVDRARQAGAYPLLADLCAEVIGPEYVDDDGLPLHRGDGRPIVPRALVVEAHLWRAYAAQAIALRSGRGSADPQWTTIGRERETAVRIAGTDLPAWVNRQPSARRPWLAAALTVVEAAQALVGGQPERTRTLTQGREPTVAYIAPPAHWWNRFGPRWWDQFGPRWWDQFGPRWWDQFGHSADRREQADASLVPPALGWAEFDADIALSRAALQVAAVRQLGADDVAGLAQLTDWALGSHRDADAAGACVALTDRLLATGDGSSAVEWVERTHTGTGLLADRYLWLLTEQGTPAAALSWVAAQPRPVRDDLAVLRECAAARLALRDPRGALRLLDRGADLVAALIDPTVRVRETAESMQLRGVALGAVLRLDEATRAFGLAASLWQAVGHPHGYLRSRRQHAEMVLHECGDVAEAALLLDGLAPQLDDDAESVAVRLLTVEARARSGDVEAAVRLVEQVLTAGLSSPRRRVQAAVAGLVATRDVERFGPVLLESLSRIQPIAAKLSLLEGLRWSAPLPAHPVLDSLFEQVVAEDAVRYEDAVVHYLQRAYVARTCGKATEMRHWLESAIRLSTSPHLAWEVIRHFGPDVPEQAYSAVVSIVSEGSPDYGAVMAGVVHLRLAEQQHHDGGSGGLPEADELAARALAELSADSRRSGWSAQALTVRAAISTDRGHVEEALAALRDAQLHYQRLGDVAAREDLAAVVAAAPVVPRVVGEWLTAPRRRLRSVGGAPQAGPPSRSGELLVTPASLRSQQWRTMSPGPQRRRAEVAGMRSALGADPDRDRPPRDHPAVPPDKLVRVEASELDVLALPWELVAERVYRSQPLTPALRKHVAWAAVGLAVVDRRVAIIKGSPAVEQSRGFSHADDGLELADSYRRAGWTAVELTAAEAGRPDLLVELRPAVIHIAGRMEISATLGWFDASSEDHRTRTAGKAAGRDTGIFVSNVVDWLAALQRHQVGRELPPMVVLDPVAAPNPADNDALLAARNRFAAGVYLDGFVLAVLATGLMDGDPFAAQQVWLAGLAQGHPLEHIVREVRRHTDLGAPPALFTPSATFTLPVGTLPAG